MMFIIRVIGGLIMTDNNLKSFYETYKDFFQVGACVEPVHLKFYREILKKHFNSLTAENRMKPIHLQPEEGEFNFEPADEIVRFAKENNKKVRGHTLVWHNQTPEWFFKNEKDGQVGRQSLLSRMEKHIQQVVNHFQDDIYCWDVVNEAIEDEENSGLFRDSKWLKIVGEDFVDQAFKYTARVSSKIKLFYNDYNAVDSGKRDRIFTMLKNMKERGVPLDGMGIQGHWNINWPSLEDIKKAIEKYASLGLDIHITELDMSMFEFGDKRKLKEPTAEMLDKQYHRYRDIFELFREYSSEISNVTLWGIADDNTWLDNFPIKNRKNWPLLFDINHRSKRVLIDIIKDVDKRDL